MLSKKIWLSCGVISMISLSALSMAMAAEPASYPQANSYVSETVTTSNNRSVGSSIRQMVNNVVGKKDQEPASGPDLVDGARPSGYTDAQWSAMNMTEKAKAISQTAVVAQRVAMKERNIVPNTAGRPAAPAK